MGLVADTVKGITGSGSKAAKKAANAQVQAAQIAADEARAAREQARTDLKPFADSGRAQIKQAKTSIDLIRPRVGIQEKRAANIYGFASDPQRQKNFVTNNVFFDALAKNAEEKLLNNQAARGKIGSGETAEALQNSIMLLGQDFVNNSINQRIAGFNATQAAFGTRFQENTARQNLVTMGQNAAAGQATATMNAGNTIADLATQSGNAQAAGIVGAQNAATGALNNVINTGMTAYGLSKLGALALSDERTKTDIREVGETKGGHRVYTYRYKHDPETVHMGVMAQEVEKKNPDAVATIAGLKLVDYSRVH